MKTKDGGPLAPIYTQAAKSDDSETRLQRLESALAKIAEKLGV